MKEKFAVLFGTRDLIIRKMLPGERLDPQMMNPTNNFQSCVGWFKATNATKPQLWELGEKIRSLAGEPIGRMGKIEFMLIDLDFLSLSDRSALGMEILRDLRILL